MARNPYTTKRGNYLLRSTRSDSLVDIMCMAATSQLVYRGHQSVVTTRNGEWVANASWEARTLVSHGLLELDHGWRKYRVTELGRECLLGAAYAKTPAGAK